MRTNAFALGLAALVAGVLFSGTPFVRAVDKSGVGPNAISLPGGPGSIEGLGESFQPDPNSGTPKYGLSIAVPPGTAGHQPSLSLSYDGGGPNGIMGFGWGMGIPFVQRQTDEGIPRYVDANNSVDDDGDGVMDEMDERDVFLSDSAEELVPLANGDYFSKNEGTFVRYRRVGAYWEGTQPDGTVLQFGVSASARIADGARVFKWLLEKEIDTHGNTITYFYGTVAGISNLNQKYLTRIEYGPGAPPRANFHFIAFTYESRPDWFEDCRSGFPVRTGRRLKEVVVGTQGPALAGHQAGDFNGDGTPDRLVSKYTLSYLNYAGAATHWSFVSQVVQTGADGTSTRPATTFTYEVCDPPASVSAAAGIIGGLNEPANVMDQPSVDLLDINGDGLPDLFETPGGGTIHRAHINQGEVFTNGAYKIKWDPGRDMTSDDGQAWNIDLQSISGNLASLADMDGDGTSDFCAYRTASDTISYFRNLGTNIGWSVDQVMSTQDFVPPSPLGVPNVTLGDFDFDKRSDIIRTEDENTYQIWFNLGNNTYSRRFTVSQPSGFQLAMQGVEVAEINGDRVPDIARIQASVIQVTAGLGYGNFSPMVNIAIPDFTLDNDQLDLARLRDINGDGLVDLTIERAQPGQLWFWLNLGNYTLSTRKVVSGLPTGVGGVAVRWADMNGNGTIDLVYAETAGTPRMQTVDLGRLIGCKASMNMMTSVNNGLGLITHYKYDSTTSFLLADRRAGKPWPDLMPFAMNVISEVLEDDTLGNITSTRYAYHNGYYNKEEKEFRGFAHVEENEIGDATEPTLVTRTFYDQGKAHEAMQGKPLRSQVEEVGGARFEETINRWISPPRVLYTGVNGQQVVFAFPAATTNVVTEKGVGVARTTESETDFDNYGNEIVTKDHGLVLPGNRSFRDDERYVFTDYALNTASWIVNKTSRVRVENESGVVASKIEFYYDDPTFSGANFGSVTKGDLTLSRAWKNPAVPGSFVAATRSTYDAYGNILTTLDPLSANTPSPAAGHYREIVIDTAFRAYPVRETVHVGGGSAPLVTSASHHAAYGVVEQLTDYNGQVTTLAFDPFGRQVSISRPGDTVGYPSTLFTYNEAVAFGTGKVNFVETLLLDRAPGSAGGVLRDHYFISRAFTDGLGRARLAKSEAGPDPVGGASLYAVAGAVTFNARKDEHRALSPYYSTQVDAFGYENVLAPGWTGRFHLDGSLVALTFANAHKITNQFDAKGRIVRTTQPDGSFNDMVYEPFLALAFDANDLNAASPHFQTPMVEETDGLGRKIRAEKRVKLNDDGTPSGTVQTWVTTYEYDLNDQLLKVTDPLGNVRNSTFDGLKRMTSRLDPDQGTQTYTYDDANNVASKTDNRGQQTLFTYDGANRLLSEDYLDAGKPYAKGRTYNPANPLNPPLDQVHRLFDGTVAGALNFPDVYHRYDAAVANVDVGDGTTSTAANVLGRRAMVVDLSGAEHDSYDTRGRMVYRIKRIPDPDTGHLVSYATRFTYDAMDRITAVTNPDNDVISYEFNARNEVGRIHGDRAGDLVSSMVHTPGGTVQSLRYANGVESVSQFDARGRPRTLITRKITDPANPYVSQLYTYDGASNLLSIDDQRPQVASTDPRHDSREFTYDNLYRLTRWKLTNPAHSAVRGILDYRYDRIFNQLHASSPAIGQPGRIEHNVNGRTVVNIGAKSFGGAAGTANRTTRAPGAAPGPGALTSTADGRSLTYDDNGNVQVHNGSTHTWDFKDRLVAVSNATSVATYTYDYADQRILRKVVDRASPTNSSHTIYVNRGFEIRPGQQPVKYVFYENLRVARISGTYSAVADRLQRFRVFAGWNLLSMGVSSSSAAAQLGIGSNASIEACFKVSGGSYVAVTAAGSLPVGTVFWVKSTVNQVLEVKGSYAEPTGQAVSTGGVYVPANGLEAVPLLSGLPAAAEIWYFDPAAKRWSGEPPVVLTGLRMPPDTLPPGLAAFVRSTSATSLPALPSGVRARYYHLDHLGTLLAVSDSAGTLVEECAYYPFGQLRNRHSPGGTREDYVFTGKERDAETGLHYFGARYYDSVLATWLSVDPMVDLYADLSPYNYVAGNPITRLDPDGRGIIKAILRALARFGTSKDKEKPQGNGGGAVQKSSSSRQLTRTQSSRSLTGSKASPSGTYAPAPAYRTGGSLGGQGGYARAPAPAGRSSNGSAALIYHAPPQAPPQFASGFVHAYGTVPSLGGGSSSGGNPQYGKLLLLPPPIAHLGTSRINALMGYQSLPAAAGQGVNAAVGNLRGASNQYAALPAAAAGGDPANRSGVLPAPRVSHVYASARIVGTQNLGGGGAAQGQYHAPEPQSPSNGNRSQYDRVQD